MSYHGTFSAPLRASPQLEVSLAGPAAAAQPPSQPAAATITTQQPHQHYTKGRSRAQASPLDPETLSSVRQAIPILADHFPGISSLLQQPQSSLNFLLDQHPHDSMDRSVTLAATKALQESPPWVHWNKQDMASPPLKADASTKLQLTATQYRGYRMARANYGVKPTMTTSPKATVAGQSAAAADTVANMYYYECIIGKFPTAKEILANLPANARLGPKLQEQLRAALEQEQGQLKQQEHLQQQSTASSTSTTADEQPDSNKRQKLDSYCRIGGHVRLGFSMRTGDLQAPVGYDKWSYGITSAGGIVHASKRQEDWNQLYANAGDTENKLHPGDVVGCAIIVNGHDNHIRFFQNGQGLGNFVIAKGKRQGGEAFSNIEQGTYYPAASVYLGGSVRANFGPHWIYPPRKLPVPLKKVLVPMSTLSQPPLSPHEALKVAQPALQLFAKKEHQSALRHAVQTEAQLRCKAYQDYAENQLQWIRQVRDERGLSVADLPDPKVPSEWQETSVKAESSSSSVATDECNPATTLPTDTTPAVASTT